MMLLVKAMSIQACHPCQKKKEKKERLITLKLITRMRTIVYQYLTLLDSVQNVWVT